MAFEFWDWEKDKEMTGVYIGQYRAIGRFKKNVFAFRTDKGVFHAWATVQLMNLLYSIPFRTKVKITYLGWEKMPDSERKFKNFDLEVIDVEETEK